MLPSLSIDSPTNNIHHLTDIDADMNMPFDNNFAYYTPHDFQEEERVRGYSLLPSLIIDSPTNNIHHLTDIDADINMPFDNNFAYYTPHDFHNNFDISQCFSNNQSFSMINCNIRSQMKI